jgi:rhodanese-related sulfurtransferase
VTSNTTVKSASVLETHTAVKSNSDAVLIDVREQDEVDQVAPDLGKFFPMSRIDPNTFENDCGVRKDQKIFLFCRSGGRSMQVAKALAAVGFTDVTNVTGGIIAWESAGLPIRKPKQKK